jgi:hypothetical protein
MALSPVRVAAGGYTFETHDGDPFLFIGFNDAIAWQGLAGLYRRRDMQSVEAYLQNIADHGVTILRLMLEYCHHDSHYFERSPGVANPTMIRLWDDLFALCERYGLRVLLTPWDSFWMSRRWHKHPYNTTKQGVPKTQAAFFTDEPTITATIRRLQMVIERWGGSGVIAAWDLFNEIHAHWGGTPAEQSLVITRISEEVREYEHRLWGFTRPQTVSIFGPDPGEHADMIFRHPCLDFATTHIYQGAIDYPQDTVMPALAMSGWVRHAYQHVPTGRPFTDSEHGPIHLFNDHNRTMPEAFDDDYERRLMWAHFASGGMGSGMRWPARHPHMVTQGMLRGYRNLAAFARHVRWSGYAPRPMDVRIHTQEVHGFASGDNNQAVVYLLRSVQNSTRVSFDLDGMTPGNYRTLFWNPCDHEGIPLDTLTETHESGGLRIEVPVQHSGLNELVVLVQRIST